jgi:hypothetical protein
MQCSCLPTLVVYEKTAVKAGGSLSRVIRIRRAACCMLQCVFVCHAGADSVCSAHACTHVTKIENGPVACVARTFA